MQNVVFNNGVEMPILGYGVFQIPDYEECKKSVLTALDAGYRVGCHVGCLDHLPPYRATRLIRIGNLEGRSVGFVASSSSDGAATELEIASLGENLHL